ncbi:MALR1 protein, partial [Indicator maculatus]|nr:MALR1 protein [Indicator maculatus]
CFNSGSSCAKCDFETDLCEALHELSSQPGWVRRKGQSVRSPPYFDHNGNDSAYFLSLSSEMKSSSAALRTSVFLPTDEEHVCQITFHYWISQTSGTLMVGVKKHSENTIADIWQDSGELQSQWKAKTITINSTEKYEVVWWGMVETQSQDETVAIDDITFSEGC